MKTIHAHLRLSTSLDGTTRDRCPDVVFSDGNDDVAAIRTDTERPALPFKDGELGVLMIHDDALSRVIDEEAWLQAFARVIAVDGTLHFTLPAEGMFAWLDTMNAHRYLTDITNRGHAPDAANPTGWNRHYRRNHIHRLLSNAGFAAPRIRKQSYASQEARFIAGMMWRNWWRQERIAELEVFPSLGTRNPRSTSGLLTTTWNVSARKR